MRYAVKDKFRAWLFRPRVEHGPILLTQRRIFILPTKQGLTLCILLILMLLGDINYNLSLGYILTFLLAMMAVMSMLHAFRNLVNLKIRPGRIEPVFKGETAHFLLYFSTDTPRYQLNLRHNNGNEVCFNLPAGTDNEITFPLASTQRGWLKIDRLTLYTEFPLGLFHAWSYVHFDTHCLVYPKPLAIAPLPSGNLPDGEGKNSITGDEDFTGLRNYIAGDALPRIAWKTYARGHPLQVKQFATQSGEEILLELSCTPEHDLEEKLAHLTRWVLDAETQGLRYGLKLPDGEINTGNGTTHRNECLRKIALFELNAIS